jgi:hypothetical protein
MFHAASKDQRIDFVLIHALDFNLDSAYGAKSITITQRQESPCYLLDNRQLLW